MEKKWTPEFLSEIEKWVEDNDTNFVAAAKHFKVSLGSIYSNRMRFNKKTDKKRKYTKARKPDLVFTAPPAVATVNNDKVVIVIANRSNISQVLTELWR